MTHATYSITPNLRLHCFVTNHTSSKTKTAIGGVRKHTLGATSVLARIGTNAVR